MDLLDKTEQRIVGVLIEKQLTVPDSYPLTENALVAGCNQSSNRDPVMALETFQVAGALMALHEKEWVARVEGAGRVPKYRHRTEERTGVEARFLPLLCELLVRGPQAPGALKPRVARMGLAATPAEIEAALRELAALPRPLVEQLPRRPRERDHRWGHLLGDAASREEQAAAPTADAAVAPASQPAARPPTPAAEPGLAERVDALETRVGELERILRSLTD